MTLHRATCPRCGALSHADKRGRMMCHDAREYDEEKPIKVKIYKRKRTGSAACDTALAPKARKGIPMPPIKSGIKMTNTRPDPDKQLKLFGG